MEPESFGEKLTYQEIVSIILLSLIIVCVVTGVVGIISIFTLDFLGLNNVFQITFGLQGLATGILLQMYFHWGTSELENEISTDEWFQINGEDMRIGIDSLKKGFSSEFGNKISHIHDHGQSTILSILGVLAMIGITIFSAVIGYIKGASLGGVFIGLFGGILGVGVGILLGLLVISVINNAFLLLIAVLTSIPLGMYLGTFDAIGLDKVSTVIITSYTWGIIILLFSIFFIFIILLPSNRFSKTILDILYHSS